MANQTILITGAAGFIGYHLSKRLLESGYAVVGFDNLNDYYDVGLKQARLGELNRFAAFSFIEGDLANEADVEALLSRTSYAAVVNLAAQAGVRYSIDHPRSYLDSNVTGFFNLLEGLRRRPTAHFLYASSSSVYGNRRHSPFSVSDKVDSPVSLYAATKKADELFAYAYAQLYGIPATAMRFFTVYGPFGRPDMAYFKFTKAIYAGETIDVYNRGELMRDFTYVDDVTGCIERMLLCPPAADENGARHAIYNIGNNRPVALKAFIETLENAIGKQAVKRYLPMQAGDVTLTCADISETTRDFGYRSETAIDVGLGKFVAWYRGYYGR